MPGRSLCRNTFRHATVANASTSTAMVTWRPSSVCVVVSGIHSLRRSRLAGMNSTASNTLRSAVVEVISSASTSVNNAGRCDR